MRRVRQTFSPIITGLMVSAGLMMSGCASVATQLPEVSETALKAEAELQETQALAKQSAHLERLMRVGRDVLLTNAELCPKTRTDLGVMIHSEESYPKELRDAVRRELGATEVPAIFKVVPNSPAERAGLQVGDSLIIDGEPVSAGDKALKEHLSNGQVDLIVRRDGDDITLSVTPDEVCSSRIRMRNSSEVNAYADGRNITMLTGMMEFTQSDDELAFVIGHELAHNTMGHVRKVIGNLILSGFAMRYARPFESEADYVGLYYMVRAGYSPDNVEAFWRRLADIDPRSVHRAKTHPTFPDRYLRLAATREEILSKQAADEPLIPNFKDDDRE
ncbi:MAG: M48 family metallopeptidase [Pseudomonadota bacterium]